ncbi:MAG: DNA recombination protein RmuC [Vulcanimicrobiaceae bacterium]
MTPLVALTIIVLVVVSTIFATLLLGRRGERAREQETADLRQQLAIARERSVADGNAQRDALTTMIERVKNELTSTQRELVESSRKEFLDLAAQRLGTTQENIASKLTELVAPMGEKLTQVDTFVRELEQSRVKAYAELRTEVEQLTKSGTALTERTTQLVSALRNPQTRGRWGEIQLRRVCELAGMLEHCDFEEQESFRSFEKSLRPDLTIKLPHNHAIFVDAKVPLDAYLNAIESTDELVREEQLRAYSQALKSRINSLANTGYRNIEDSADFVVMFIPGENFLSAACAKEPSLVEYAAERSVFIVGPLTLMALLRSYGMVWQNVKQEARAKQIADEARDFYDRFIVFAKHLKALGSSLDASVDAFNKAIGSYERKVLPKGREMAKLAAFPLDGETGEVSLVDAATRRIVAKKAVAAIETTPNLNEDEDDDKPA